MCHQYCLTQVSRSNHPSVLIAPPRDRNAQYTRIGFGLLPWGVCVRSFLIRHYDAAISANWSPLLRYGIALLSVGCAYFLTLLVPEIHHFTPFLFYIPAVVVSSIYGGPGPSVLSAVLALLVAPEWVLISGGLLPISTPYLLPTIAFVVIVVIIVLLSYALRRTRRGLASERRQNAAQLRSQQFLLDHMSDAVFERGKGEELEFNLLEVIGSRRHLQRKGRTAAYAAGELEIAGDRFQAEGYLLVDVTCCRAIRSLGSAVLCQGP